MPNNSIEAEVSTLGEKVSQLERAVAETEGTIATARSYSVGVAVAAAFAIGAMGFLHFHEVPRQAREMVEKNLGTEIEARLKQANYAQIEARVNSVEDVAKRAESVLASFEDRTRFNGEYQCESPPSAVSDERFWIEFVSSKFYVGRTTAGQALLGVSIVDGTQIKESDWFDHFLIAPSDEPGRMLRLQHRVAFKGDAKSRTIELYSSKRPPDGTSETILQTWKRSDR